MEENDRVAFCFNFALVDLKLMDGMISISKSRMEVTRPVFLFFYGRKDLSSLFWCMVYGGMID